MRIIQALMEAPKYLLSDEPFDGLDSTMKTVVKELINEIIRVG